MRRYICAILLAIACASPPTSRRVGNSVRPAVDSIVLERTECFGRCPVYRLRIDNLGRAHFASPDPKGQGTTASDQLGEWVPDTVEAHARRIGFADLPADILTNDALCQYKVTDHPGIVLAIYGAPEKRVSYYTGCYIKTSLSDRTVAPALIALKDFAARIDSLAGTSRWVRPHAIR